MTQILIWVMQENVGVMINFFIQIANKSLKKQFVTSTVCTICNINTFIMACPCYAHTAVVSFLNYAGCNCDTVDWLCKF